MVTMVADFEGYDDFIVAHDEEIPEEIPDFIRPIDTGKLHKVNLDRMYFNGDGAQGTICLRDKGRFLTKATATIFYFVVLNALNGKRKISTVKRWTNEFTLFTRLINAQIKSPITTITFNMFNWHSQNKNAAQQKILRSILKFWILEGVPGISSDLKNYIIVSKAPKHRSTIEIQNTVAKERPFTIEQIRQMLSSIEDLYINKNFSPQDYLMWRLIISEAMRPSQMQLLRCGDVKFIYNKQGKFKHVILNVPIVKQTATPARKYMMEYQLSEPVSQAMADHFEFLTDLLGQKPNNSCPIFSVIHSNKNKPSIKKAGIGITSRISRTRSLISIKNTELEDIDLFTRRFKHTKLTHLAMLGAPLEVLARAGFQTSTESLKHYVNLTEEAFVEYENLLSHQYDQIVSSFKGRVLKRHQSTNLNSKNHILDPEMDDSVGSCASKPCSVFAPFGCYVCIRFEAFTDGPHNLVLNVLITKKERAIQMGLPIESVRRDEYIIAAVREVIATIEKENNNGR